MSIRCVLEPLPDPSIKVDLRLVAMPTRPRVCGINFEVRLQMTVEGEETHAADCWCVDLRRIMINRCVMVG